MDWLSKEYDGRAGSRGEERETCMTEENIDIMWKVTNVSVLCQLILFCLDKKAFGDDCSFEDFNILTDQRLDRPRRLDNTHICPIIDS